MESIIAVESLSRAQLILPEIKARICKSNQTILVKIRCAKRKGRIGEILRVVENLNLGIINFSAATFAPSALHVTIVAKMENESTSPSDIATPIRDLLYKSLV